MKLLRLHAVVTKQRAAVVGDDVDVMTFDFEILDSVWPDDGTGTHNMATMEGDFITFWKRQAGVTGFPHANSGAVAAYVGAAVGLSQFRWYREDDGSPPFGDAIRISDITRIPGVGATCPPQVACTVTEKTSSRRHWGRFYIPGIAAAQLNADGSLTTNALEQICHDAKALYDSWRTRGVRPIVYGKQPVNSASVLGTTIDSFHTGYHVIALRTDDVLDVQRSRRFNSALARKEMTTANP